MADMTLEGGHSVLDTKGEGTAHVCRNKKEVWDWLEERRVDDLRSIVVGLVDWGCKGELLDSGYLVGEVSILLYLLFIQ
jgi:hypothetical protein